MFRDTRQSIRLGSIDKQWYYTALVTAAIAISYFDRQTLPVAVSAIQKTIPITDQQFSWLQFAFLIPYALLYAARGRMLDIVGTRRGFLLIMLWWSCACNSTIKPDDDIATFGVWSRQGCRKGNKNGQESG